MLDIQGFIDFTWTCPLAGGIVLGGAGGSRTRVQTRKSYAFYMLISA